MQKLLQLAAALLLSGLPEALSGHNHTSCRCKPEEKCWPSPHQWKALNESVHGNLVAVRPVGNVCHDPTYDPEACARTKNITHNSFWRVEQPGAVQFTNWETWLARKESCYVDTPRGDACDQGRVSLYSVLVESPSQIQSAVRFARKHNLRLAIKASGHDFLGRSSAPDSLQISTYRMKDIIFTDDFVPKGCKTGGKGSAVTLGAGVVLTDLYKALSKKGVVAVAGLAHTVAAPGGYIQGGGHSPLGPWKGMASDNALEFEVITPKGDLITVNEFQNSDLFWALRGGGGGTFGVVASVTIRTWPDPPMVLGSVNISTSLDNSKGYWAAVKELHAALPELSKNGASGYYFIVPQSPPLPDIGSVSAVVMALMFADQDDQAAVERLLQPLTAAVNKLDNVTISTSTIASPRSNEMIVSLLQGDADDTGNAIAIGSRLISRDFLVSSDGPAKLSDALSRLDSQRGSVITGHLVAGGQVAKNAGKVNSALNPAWRKALTHITFGYSWPSSTPFHEQQKIYEKITKVEVPILRSLEPGQMGSYLNEADSHESDFQESFWGENYERLYAVKQKWDPTGLLISRRGVGSEDWDDDGLCRVN
ncbi:FAD binding domain-containing protein [Histoplasma capsulatum G186AR]|uniref:FAD binding domain-containing protein n=2 Tax=Ajellomyces capsulatus TaxID=5037 RepID=C0NJF7_AJECG|nr:FAD binding domain-containing protein [Histoplasma capsulatum G186AR]EEH07998.1 FAD binding domain-containing protein [Histoplasma capsulatum G186AR]KAG5299680.1 FAD binding domain-containing protein [Histoplasma capsulatum]QSS67694.1 FAD binding domain-containing protein [Histoplasma capsulatum G186AR]